MSEETEVQEAEAPEEAPESEESGVEAKAREMGWRPKDEWEGDPDRWIPADQFVERNEHLKGRGDKILQTENAKLSREISEMKQTIDELKSHMTKQERNAYNRALNDLRKEQRQAVEEGDTQRFDAAQRQMDEMNEQIAREHEQSQPKQPQNPDQDPDFVAWHSENGWYNDDVEATAYADHIAPIVARKTGYQGKALYDAIASEVKAKFPTKFGKANGQRRAPAVEGTTSKGGGKTKWDQVDAEGRAAFNRFVKQGVFKDTKQDREKYADDYLNG